MKLKYRILGLTALFQLCATYSAWALTVPDKPVLLAPSGTITAAMPSYTWQPVLDSDSYQLTIVNAAGKLLLKQFITASQAQCANERDDCLFKPTISLPLGKFTWKLRAKNAAGFGLQAVQAFRRGVPDAPVTTAPTGDINTATPSYQWQAVSGVGQYNLQVSSSASVVLDKWYSPSQAGCPTGKSVCKVTPTTPLKEIANSWKVRAKNALGNGPWSAVKSFSNLSSCNIVLVNDATTGGCHIRLVEPAACEEIDLSNGKEYTFGWTTDGTYCETPWTFYIAGNPANVMTGENIYWKDFSTDVSLGITHYGGLVRLSAASLDSLGLTSDNGVYHWLVTGWYGSHPASRTFRVKR